MDILHFHFDLVYCMLALSVENLEFEFSTAVSLRFPFFW